MSDDLTLRTVTYKGDIDEMGVVLEDQGGERVKVTFGDGKASGARGWNLGEWVDRRDLEDVTDSYDLAHKWGYTETSQADGD